ncbi:MAG: helix-turn-helix domain-containing protein [Elusimicrobia bacterium]|jgi:excisionase family DNA binding protein|nr:helix-turn-helix domain-containing protein [Elusimicrobiota bacterium]
MSHKKFLSTPELAEIMGISRIAVFKKIKKGEIKAIKIGRNYAIPVKDILSDKLSKKQEKTIKKAIDKTIKEYGEVLKKLGKNGRD